MVQKLSLDLINLTYIPTTMKLFQKLQHNTSQMITRTAKRHSSVEHFIKNFSIENFAVVSCNMLIIINNVHLRLHRSLEQIKHDVIIKTIT